MRGSFFLKPMDFLAILLSLGMIVLSALGAYARPDSPPGVRIRSAGQTWLFPLDAEETLAVPGPLGDTVIEISQGGTRVLSSPCPNQSCVAAGHIRRRGQWTACLPNGVLLMIEGGADGGEPVDAAAW
jgi:hypothetical protein